MIGALATSGTAYSLHGSFETTVQHGHGSIVGAIFQTSALVSYLQLLLAVASAVPPVPLSFFELYCRRCGWQMRAHINGAAGLAALGLHSA